MAKLRGLVLGGLFGLLVLCAPPAQAVPVAAPLTSHTVTSAPSYLLAGPTTPPPGPVLDPAQTDKANSEKTRNKVIAGVIAVVLAGLIWLGRRARKPKKKKKE